MSIIKFIVDHWFVFVALVALLVVVGLAIRGFLRQPRKEQLDKLREWLLWAVIQAEQELGGGTGELKLRSVYNLFVQRFPWLARVITFDTFGVMVDEALERMRKLLENNEKVKALVEGESSHE